MRVLALLLVWLLACAEEPARERLLREARGGLDSVDEAVRFEAHSKLMISCCATYEVEDSACAMLNARFATTVDPISVTGALRFWTSDCVGPIQRGPLLRLLESPKLAVTPEIGAEALRALSEHEPSIEVADAAMRFYASLPGPDWAHVSIAGTRMNPMYVASLIGSLLRRSDDATLERVFQTVHGLANAALQDIYLRALTEAAGLPIWFKNPPSHSDAFSARVREIVEDSQTRTNDEVVAVLLGASGDPERAELASDKVIEVLGHRRFACRSPRASVALVRFAFGRHEPRAAAARRAIAFRATHCD